MIPQWFLIMWLKYKREKKHVQSRPGLPCTPQIPSSIGEHVTFVAYFAETTTSFRPAAVLPPLTFSSNAQQSQSDPAL